MLPNGLQLGPEEGPVLGWGQPASLWPKAPAGCQAQWLNPQPLQLEAVSHQAESPSSQCRQTPAESEMQKGKAQPVLLPWGW